MGKIVIEVPEKDCRECEHYNYPHSLCLIYGIRIDREINNTDMEDGNNEAYKLPRCPACLKAEQEYNELKLRGEAK